MKISELLTFAFKNNSSDVHLSAGLPPMLRIDGELTRIEAEPLTDQQITKLLQEIMTENQMTIFKKELEVDFSFEINNLSRFRVNAFMQNRGIAAVLRLIPEAIPSLSELGLPEIFQDFCLMPKGLVIVTGPTGSGKSSTLAAMINFINDSKSKHIITIEDPIEFVHKSNKCLINQREVHRDTHGFNISLKSALREDPDIILIGEMRDLETIRLALTAAETGHLVFGTLHTTSAIQTINRIIDVFPGSEQNLVRSMLSESLNCVISKTLLKKKSGGRIVALEIMRQTHAISNLIRENKIPQMYSAIQSGAALGMHTLDQHLLKLVKDNLVDTAVAEDVAINKDTFTTSN
ncbi:MAG: type IV pilus twitching motility protein PilT [Legionellales bacterium]|nr:type IV pilus twitching motility protein PilT [Legionellales bacterium]